MQNAYTINSIVPLVPTSRQQYVPTIQGTPRQRQWAEQILQQRRISYRELPAVISAKSIIESRELSVKEMVAVLSEPQPFISPFTTVFPRYGREDAQACARQLLSNGFVALDCESTGLKKTDSATEISLVSYPSMHVLFNSVIRPLDVHTVRNEHVGQISLAEMLEAPTFSSVQVVIRDILSNNHVVAFNNRFDIPLLLREFTKIGVTPPSVNSTCAMKLFSTYMGDETIYSLAEACSTLGIRQDDNGIAHRALADTLTLIQVVEKIASQTGYREV